MGKERRRPSWWQVWLLLPALGILAFLEARASLSPAGHKVAEVAIILVIYGLVSVWLRANQPGLLRETSDTLSQTGAETTISLPSAPGIIAGSNGNGHRESPWCVPAYGPDADLLITHQESDS